jgi:hypothetical protein
MITALGSPSHLGFWYDEDVGRLIFAPAAKDELDSYEIPPYFWAYPNSVCIISRIAFFNALIYRVKPESGSKYAYFGKYEKTDGVPAVVFDMKNGKKLR